MSKTRSPVHSRLVAALVAVLTIEALAFDAWPVVAVAAAVSVVDGVAPASPFAAVARAVSAQPYPLRPATPGRRGALVRGGALGLAALLLALGPWAVGAALAGAVALESLVDAIAGRCLVCAGLTRGRPPAIAALGLVGAGPWLVGVDARGCVLCGRVLDVLSERAAEPVHRVVLEERPEAAAYVRVVPTALRIGSDGSVAGRLEAPRDPAQIDAFLERLNLEARGPSAAPEDRAGD